MLMPAMNGPTAPLASATSLVLNFPIDDLVGALAALALVGLGAATVVLSRSKRSARSAAVPRWAS